MHLSTVVSSLVLASAVSASSHLASAETVARLSVRSEQQAGGDVHEKKVKMQCIGPGCGAFGGAINAGAGFAAPIIFNGAPTLGNFGTFGAACGATLGLWQGVAFQQIQQQFSMMVLSMASLIAPFQNGCGAFCAQAMGPAFLQTITQVIMQMQALVQFIFTTFPGQIGVFQNHFQAIEIFFQVLIAIGTSLSVPILQVFGGGQFNMGLWQNCGFGFNGGIPAFPGVPGIGGIGGIAGGFGGMGGGLGGIGIGGGLGGIGGPGGIGGGLGAPGAIGAPGIGGVGNPALGGGVGNPALGGGGFGVAFGHVGLLGQILNPLVQLLMPVTQGLGSLLHNVGGGLGSLLSGGLL
ncbi:hypothetical protein DFH28DRAFT_983647 [Melampsora americana]|nr:hypothetical protein DFH28DRAFT_983647 [Melampsora americana]